MRRFGVTLCLLGAMLLSGCALGDINAMYALPRASDTYVRLQNAITEEKGTAEFTAPVSGENCQTIQLEDVDGDGEQEAVTFFRDTAADAMLRLVVFKQNSSGDYEVCSSIEGAGSEIEFVEYRNFTGSQGDILVSWRVSSSLHTLAAYSLADGKTTELMLSGYGQYFTADLDNDGEEELLLAQRESGRSVPWRLEYYDLNGDILEMGSAAGLSADVSEPEFRLDGMLGETPALFLTSLCGADTIRTDVFRLENGALRNISVDADTRCSENRLEASSPLRPADIDKDGSVEVPTLRSGADSAAVQWIDWLRYGEKGSIPQTAVRTCRCAKDGWTFRLPDSWKGDFTARRQETGDVAAVNLYRDDAESPFLILRAYRGDAWEKSSQPAEEIVLSSAGNLVYTAVMPAKSWDCGLTRDTIRAYFSANTQ